MSIRRWLCFLIVFVVGTSICSAQFFDSLRVALTHPPKPDIRLDIRTSFISNHAARIGGVRAGMSFNKVLHMGVQYSWLQSKIERLVRNPQGVAVKERLRLQYLSLYIAYRFASKGRWETTIPVLLGAGVGRYTSEGRTTQSNLIVFYEPSMVWQYRLLPWLAVGAGMGYRIPLTGGKQLEQDFSSPTLITKVRILLFQ